MEKKNKNISANDLIEKYIENGHSLEYLHSIIEIKEYVGYANKMILADNILNNSCLKNGLVHIDSCKKYVMYVYALIDNYTNVKIEEKNVMMQFDSLNKYGLVDEIINMIPKNEVEEFKSILEMKQNDLMTNKYEIHAYISDLVTFSLPLILESLQPTMSNIDDKIKSLDSKDIVKAINNIAKML